MLERPDKLRIDHKPVFYEGLPATSAIGMALFESTGARRLIDQRCSFDPDRRILSPGMVVKTILGPMFDNRHKSPLYITGWAYSSAPVDRLLGPEVERDDLYDNALARGLDALGGTDELEELFYECAELGVRKYGLSSDVRHMDATDFSVYCEKKDDPGDGTAVPAHSGKPKDGRRDLLQYKMQFVTDSNRIIRQWKPHSGNASDVTMNKDSLDFIGRHLDDEERAKLTVVGDSKLVSEPVLKEIRGLGVGFVSRCPENFGDRLASRTVDAAFGGLLFRHGGIRTADLDMEAWFGKGRKQRTETYRMVVKVEDWRVEEKYEALVSEHLDRARRPYGDVLGSLFRTREEAESALAKVVPADTLYTVNVSVEEVDPMAALSEMTGSRCVLPGGGMWWRPTAKFVLDEAAARSQAERAVAFVIITNLPRRRTGTFVSYRVGSSTQDVIDLYEEEYVVEHSFRLTKSGLGIDEVFLQTPSRENAMMFVVALAAHLKSVADAVFRSRNVLLEGKVLTMHRLEAHLQTEMVCFDRSQQRLYTLMGKGRIYGIDVFKVVDVLGINPQLLLGYLSD